MNMMVCGDYAGRIEEHMRRLEEIRRKAEMKRRVAEIQKEVNPWEKRNATVEPDGKERYTGEVWEKVKGKCMEIIQRRGMDIMRRKEEQNEHTVQERGIGALRIVTADQG